MRKLPTTTLILLAAALGFATASTEALADDYDYTWIELSSECLPGGDDCVDIQIEKAPANTPCPRVVQTAPDSWIQAQSAETLCNYARWWVAS